MVPFLKRFLEALVTGLVAGFVLLVLAPVVLGWRPYTVLTGSMRPGIQPGDVVMDRPIRITQAHVGQVVTFSDPTRHGELVTHRIRSIAHAAGMTTVETRGDANTTSEHWTIATKDRVGLVVYRLPKIGKVAVLVRSRVGILLVIVVPVLLLGVGLLRKIWQEDDGDDDDPDAGAPDPDTVAAAPVPAPAADAVALPEAVEPVAGPAAPHDPVDDAPPHAMLPAERAGIGADR
ncbi:MAG: signal peptidase I [Solirubrobacteraceae bacterium]|nr:signal peptidase I [Patulibacter sp.]